MIAALDAHYDEDTLAAVAAAVVFGHWDDAAPAGEYTAVCEGTESYVPGEFYRRELPCLLAVLKQIIEPLDAIVVDGYVSLGDKPGLGMRLWDALERNTPVIGVAKTRFQAVEAEKVMRGTSKQPLYVTVAGIELPVAAANIGMMAGDFRIPTLLKRVDRLARDELANQIE
jgi:deoxyribonuclease V